MPMTQILTLDADGKFEVFPAEADLPPGRQWEAVRFENPGKALDGGDLIYYVSRTEAFVPRISQGRAVFVHKELLANKDALKGMPDGGVLDWLQLVVFMKCMFTGAAVESTTIRTEPLPPPEPGKFLLGVSFIDHFGREIDISDGPAPPPGVYPQLQPRPDDEPPPPPYPGA